MHRLATIFIALLLPTAALAQPCSFSDLAAKWMLDYGGYFFCPIKISGNGTVVTQGNCIDGTAAPTGVVMTLQGNCSVTFDFGFFTGGVQNQMSGVGWVSLDRSRIDGYLTSSGGNSASYFKLIRRTGLQ